MARLKDALKEAGVEITDEIFKIKQQSNMR